MDDVEYWNYLYDTYGCKIDADGDAVDIEYSRLGGTIEISGVAVRISIRREKYSPDPWHIEIAQGAYIVRQLAQEPTSCLVDRFWDDEEAFEALRARLVLVGIGGL